MSPAEEKRRGANLRIVALVAILGLPFALYVAAQARRDVLSGILLGLMGLAMLALIAARDSRPPGDSGK